MAPAISTGRAPRRSTTRPIAIPYAAHASCIDAYAPATRPRPPNTAASGVKNTLQA